MNREERIEKLKKYIITLEQARKPGRWKFAISNGLVWGVIVGVIMVIMDVFIDNKYAFLSVETVMTIALYIIFGVLGFGLLMYWFYGRLITKYKKEIATHEQQQS